MKIRIDVNGTPVSATLDDNETSRDFVSLLPLTLTLEDYKRRPDTLGPLEASALSTTNTQVYGLFSGHRLHMRARAAACLRRVRCQPRPGAGPLGRRTVNTVPSSRVERTLIVPWCAATTSFEMNNPSPTLRSADGVAPAPRSNG